MAALTPLLNPAAVAVVGASDDPATFGGRFWRHLGDCPQVRRAAVNFRPGAVRDGELVGRVADLAAAPDVVVVATPAATVAAVIDEAAARGARAAVVLPRVPAEVESRVRDVARAHSMLLLGGSSLGLINTNDGVLLSSSVSLELPVRAGPLALVSQSGAVMGVLHARAMCQGIGLGLCVATGDQLQLRVEDVLAHVIDDPRLVAAAAYLEDVDPALFCEVADGCREAGKRLVLLEGGRSPRGSAAAAAHSGALLRDGRALATLARSHGVLVVSEPAELLATLHACCVPGRRWFIATLSGGLATLAADLAAEAGVPLADPPSALDSGASSGNPVDVDAVAATDDDAAKLVGELTADLIGDGCILVVSDKPGLGGLLTRVAALDAETRQRLHVVSECSGQYAGNLEDFVAAGGVFVDRMASFLPALAGTRERDRPRRLGSRPGTLLPAFTVHELLASSGLPSLPLTVVEGPDDLDRAFTEFGVPLVLKVADVGHRGSVGVRRVTSSAEAVAAYAELQRQGRVVAQPHARPGLEFYVGFVNDAAFGWLFLLGAGGPDVEQLKDVALHVGLPSRADAEACLLKTSVGRWLSASLGREAADLDALLDVVADLAMWVQSFDGAVDSVDVNPVVAHDRGATVVDAKVRVAAARLKEQARCRP
ncbi:MAG: acetate--CoA ligase family protein [Acidimicrobiales bacterium]